MCGLQQGSPSVLPYRVDLMLFDSSDQRYKILIYPLDDHPTITQAQINAIVASIHAASLNEVSR
jgi:hypothetical protein